MLILGVDPGATTGWALYDAPGRTIVEAGHFRGHEVDSLPTGALEALAVIERPKGYGPTRPQIVDCGYVCGRLSEWLSGVMEMQLVEMTRREVCQELTAAMHGVVNVRNDATAWAALLELHGGADAAKKGGPLYGVKSHARAALAVAVAYALREGIGA